MSFNEPELIEAIEHSADPAAVRAVLERIVERVAEAGPLAHDAVVAELGTDAAFRDGLVAVAGASRSLVTGLIADPGLLDVVRDRVSLSGERAPVDYVAASLGLDEGGLRRWKRAEFLRIAVRDLTGLADLPAVGRELAGLAEGCLSAALAIAAPAVPFAVLGMGKLGGSELNYASDVDVIFVHDGEGPGPAAEAARAARGVLSAMSTPTDEGIVFRTDADLRPEGRAGPLSRTISGFRTYWEQWAGHWEFQALLKARLVCGDVDLAERFFEVADPFIWPERLDPAAIREIQAMKLRAEHEMTKKGLELRELKRGKGGIRDIEFAVQLLQLVHARHQPELRSRNTLIALASLVEHGYVDPPDAEALDEAYRFLRDAEHRLQLQDERQVHALPADTAGRTRLARVMGHRDRPEVSALEQFDERHRQHQTTVRTIHEKLFFRPALAAFAGVGALSSDAAEERLAAFGFRDAERTRAAMRELTAGYSRTSKLMQQLFPLLLDWLSRSPDPDLGLLQLRTVAEGDTRARALATAFRDSPTAAERTCFLLGSSRVVGQAMRRVPEFPALLETEAALTRPKDPGLLRTEALDALRWRSHDADDRAAGLRRFKRRELLRIAARDLLGMASLEDVQIELSALADASLEGALAAIEPGVPIAVIGLGRYGGQEMSYASDLDVVYVYDGDGPTDFRAAETAVEALNRDVGALTPEGQAWQVDTKLRPEGRQGQLALPISGYESYWNGRALVWEFQAHLKARVVAGDKALGERFLQALWPQVYVPDFGDDGVREVRRMKARIERERIPAGDDPQFHLKLGKGSLSDVDFTVQLLQLVHGHDHPAVRVASTVEALTALTADGLLDAEDAGVLWEAYRFCSRARNYRFLHTAKQADSLPQTAVDAEHLATMLGYTHRPVTSMRDDYRRVTRRARRVMERLFYGRD